MPEQERHPNGQQGQEDPSYSEQEAIEYSRLETHIIHHLCDAGIIRFVEEGGQKRRYYAEDLILMRRVRRLHHDLGVNLEGVEIIVRLTARLDALQRELAQYKKVIP
jgi:DNA-binding transcriptional MerR regulator